MKPENTSPEISKYPKVKAEFEIWYWNTYYHSEPSGSNVSFGKFKVLPFDFKQGVYLAFLREKGITISILPDYSDLEDGGFDKAYYLFVVYELSKNITVPDYSSPAEFKDYNTALIAAIEAGFAKLEADFIAK